MRKNIVIIQYRMTLDISMLLFIKDFRLTEENGNEIRIFDDLLKDLRVNFFDSVGQVHRFQTC
jgi:hypothetical protein